MKNESTYVIGYSKPFGLTEEASVLRLNFSNAYNTYIGTSIVISKKFEQEKFIEFIQLKNKWKHETVFFSSGSSIISNSSYQKIINFGTMAIPWIIRELKKNDDHWFYALEKITGTNPIEKINIGKVDEMKKDWLKWANEKYNL